MSWEGYAYQTVKVKISLLLEKHIHPWQISRSQKLNSSTSLIDIPMPLANLIDSIIDLPASLPSLYIDLEGIKRP